MNINLKRKLKTIVKNLFLKNNHSKIEIIKNASWIANEKSHNYFHWFGDALQRVEFLIEKNTLSLFYFLKIMKIKSMYLKFSMVLI